MQSQEHLQRSVETARDLLELVRTMKALAAVGLRVQQGALASLEVRRRILEEAFQVVLRSSPGRLEPSGDRLGVLALGSDQGMCGAFNESMGAFVERQLEGRPPVRLMVLGRRLANELTRRGLRVDSVRRMPVSPAGFDQAAAEVLVELEQARLRDGLDAITVYSHQPVGGARHRPQAQTLLPLDPAWLAELAARPWESRCLPTFALPVGELFGALARQWLYFSLYRCLVGSLLSENASRLRAMLAAEGNLEKRLERLQRQYHQARQEAVTAELLDLMAGYEAVRGAS